MNVDWYLCEMFLRVNVMMLVLVFKEFNNDVVLVKDVLKEFFEEEDGGGG